MDLIRVHTYSLILAALALAGCASPSTTPAPVIDLADLQPLPTAIPREIVPLRVAVAAVISPQGTAESYQPLLEYLSATLNRPVELVQRATYAETNALVQVGLVDVAFVCTGAYIVGARDFGMELLVAPEINGEPAYYSLLIVPAGSPAQRLADLRGKVFAFVDPLSNTGRLYPTYLVHQLGEKPETFFARTFFTYSHDDAIRAVVDGLADGAAVDSLIYAYLLEREPWLEEQVRVVHRSPPFGIPPVVVNPNIRPQLRAELQALFLGMSDEAEGKAVLRQLGIDRFVLLPDSAYDSVRALRAAVGDGLTEAP
jgi:phosphonate transport system substrate-binding protein